MNDKFLNSYHFVPTIEGPAGIGEGSLAISHARDEHFGFTNETASDGHAIYAANTFSGRIVCKLTTKTPLVVGAAVKDNNQTGPHLIQPFCFRGRAAIPATSIKGMISSVVEAVSGSAMRVLTDSQLHLKKWRGRRITIGLGTTFDFFSHATGAIETPDILPMSNQRALVTPAERLFGYVPLDSRTDKKGVRAVAGRVRVSHARCLSSNKDVFEETPWHLKELSSPKNAPTPNPAMYFRSVRCERVAKEKASLTPGVALPQGRKFYLHQNSEGQPWRTALDSAGLPNNGSNRQSMVEAIKGGVEFLFHIDVDNVSLRELQLICFALHPSKSFWHKLGHGKPIGLGSVEVRPLAFLEVERSKRYSSANSDLFDIRRYVCHGDRDDVGLPEILLHEPADDALHPEKLAEAGKQYWKDKFPDAVSALLSIGEYHPTDSEPHLPVLQTPLPLEKLNALRSSDRMVRASAELETFKWFVNNDKAGQSAQYLRPLGKQMRMVDVALEPNCQASKKGQ